MGWGDVYQPFTSVTEHLTVRTALMRRIVVSVFAWLGTVHLIFWGGVYIPAIHQCDGTPHCTDGADEKDCRKCVRLVRHGPFDILGGGDGYGRS